LFFKHYLSEFQDSALWFYPKVLSFEEFIEKLYVELNENPFPLSTDLGKVLLFYEVLKEENPSQDWRFLLNWSFKFVEVFEEVEKEGKDPEDILYPPEGFPEIAIKFFEKLRYYYQKYSQELLKVKVSTFSQRLKSIAESLKSLKEIPFEVSQIWFVGFAALRGAELEIFKWFRYNLNNSYFVFETGEEVDPIIQKTTSELELEPSFLEKSFFYDKDPRAPEIKVIKAPNLHLQVERAIEEVKCFSENPEKVAMILPNSTSLLPLIYSLQTKKEEVPINITLQYPITRLPLNQLLLLILKVQKNRSSEGLYETKDYLKLLKHPIIKEIKLKDEVGLNKLISEVEEFLKERGDIKVSPKTVEAEFVERKNALSVIHEVLFYSWEEIKTPFDLVHAVKKVFDLIKPVISELIKEESLQGILLRNYLYVIETKILPVFEEKWIKNLGLRKEELLEVLEYMLLKERVPFTGDPLKGLQIMGFLETRLLNFEDIIILDLNEGYLPPTEDFNPLLTDEIKRYLGIPVYKNQLWQYYFNTLISRGKNITLLYVFKEKSGTQEFREPSRFLHQIKWKFEKHRKELKEENISFSIKGFQKSEGIKKTDSHREFILNYLSKREVSRYFIESYLKCQVGFYFKYVLRLERPKKIGIEAWDVGNFIHDFFQKVFEPYLGKSVSIKELWETQKPLELMEKLWEKYGFSKKMNKLVHFFAKKIAQKSIERYFEYLINKEVSGEVKETEVIGIEKSLRYKEQFEDTSLGICETITLTGIADFIIKRKEGVNKYLIMDYKSNPYFSSGKRKVENFIKTRFQKPFSENDPYQLYDELGNAFQLVFYYYLFYKNRSLFIKNEKEFFVINCGFITPTDLRSPEKFVFGDKKKKFPEIYRFFEKCFPLILKGVFSHMLNADVFAFPPDDSVCKYCEYKAPCKNYKYLL